MSKRGTVPALKDILEAISRTERYVGKATLGEFMANTKTQDAVVRNLEIIGEAVRNFPPDFRTAHPEVEWAKIVGIRDRLIHQYFSVDWDILWDVVSDKLPALKVQVERILDEIKSAE